MNVFTKICMLVLITALVCTCALPVSAQAGSHTTLQVWTDESVLGRVVSITHAPDDSSGGYSVSITRGMSAQPAKTGDSILEYNVLILGPGSFATVSLADRGETMFGGGTGGTAIVFERGGSSLLPKPTPEATDVRPKVLDRILLPDGGDVDVGRITSVRGKGYIQRQNRVMSATVGERLMAGDTVYADDGSEVIVQLDHGGRQVVEGGNSLHLERQIVDKPTSVLEPIVSIIEDTWMKVKEFLSGESFSSMTPSAIAGVRG